MEYMIDWSAGWSSVFMKPKRSETRHLGLLGETPTVWQKLECVTLVISHHRNDWDTPAHTHMHTRGHTHTHTPQSPVAIWDSSLIVGKVSMGACLGDRYVPHLDKLCIIHSTLLLSAAIDLLHRFSFALLFYLFMIWFFPQWKNWLDWHQNPYLMKTSWWVEYL